MLDRAGEQELESLFHQALDLEPTERAAFVEARCQGNAELGARLRALLSEDAAGTHSIFKQELPLFEGAPRVGPYRLLRVLGEGGMGTVFLAQQEEPVRRKVALKMIRAGMASDTVVARFLAERETLARMEHSGIARMYFAGMTDDGRPYLAMEYVDGLALGAYCGAGRLSIRARLELFCKICDAVQYAHQQGVIHRDLKPTNVLVADEDGGAQPKIIDFGIARTTAGSLIGPADETYPGAAPGTRAYMSPEQAGSNRPVDARSDIHALGVMLYELLVGELPFDARALAAQGLEQAQRTLLEDDPPAPSRRFQALEGGVAGAHARARQTSARGVVEALHGDLDWIIMRAIEKNPAQRYASASELKADLQRHLRDEPVMAGPPTTAYRVSKFVRRHRVGALLTGVTCTAVLVALVATVRSLYRAEAARRTEAELRQRLEVKSLRKSAIAEMFNYALLGDLSLDAQFSVRDLIDRAAAGVRERFAGRPEEEAAARYVLGTSFLRFGDIEAAHEQFQQAYANQLAFEERDQRGLFRTLTRLIHTTRLLEGEAAVPRLESRCEQLALDILSEENPMLERRLRALLDQVGGASAVPGLLTASLTEVLRLLAEDADATPAGGWLVAKILSVRPEIGHAHAGGGHLAGLWDLAEGQMRAEQIESLTLRWFVARTLLLPPDQDFDAALDEARALIDEARRFLPSGHWILVDAERIRGEALSGLGRFEEAEAALLDALRVAELRSTQPLSPLLQTRAALVDLATAWQDSGSDWLPGCFARWRTESGAAGLTGRTDWWVVRHPGAAARVYGAAAEFLASLESSPRIEARIEARIEPGIDLGTLRALALARAGAHDAALELLGPAPPSPTAALVRVIALRGLDRSSLADAELAALDLAEPLAPELQGYLEEARHGR